ncbi:TRAP transporter substrate-binding protein DctP [Treponema phagedenis]|uniref:TRAP transporter substrate-binding protein DctP n=2 Tax=Treponema phagedenis TaxID=162 RepID=A0AAE6ITT1_TREPH|nr:TRAP transporter substrate-binding protein DctP [Treponema phagedenis]QEJ97796.1 TRAP transporter substrate-binding protein DctP [Treponema phagedenis]QEK01316.1 TRAP transporter substrate-binding protein DctP [Treponema phagedenis]QEK06334.1 TRAP transporter substrate-binding protein DctP [Treponema phagedenis]QEK08991.1 TRAP transporter substrate-binding protein DctP [Treponema phagedenis]
MFMKKRCVLFIFAVFFLSGFVAAEKITLKIATVAPARSPWEIELKKLAQEWNRITKGQVSVRFYNMTVLGGEKAGVQKLRSARPGQPAPMDGAIFSSLGLHELEPKSGIYTLSLPFLIKSQKELDLVLKTYGKDIEDPIANAGFQLITWSNVGWLSFYTKESYRTLKELKSIKLSLSGMDSPILSNSFKVSGFNVKDTPITKFAQALKSGGVSGFLAVHLATWATGFYKDINYALDSRICPIMAGFVISKESWNKIPAQYQAPMLAAAEKARKALNESLDSSDREYVKKMEQAGVKMIRLTPQELTEWQKEFNMNIDQVNKSLPGAFSMPLYKKIQSLLAS